MPVLATKLQPPRPRRRLVPRARLVDRLHADGGEAPRLVLVAAPAGVGKTTLLTQWLAKAEGSQRTVAWLQLAALSARGRAGEANGCGDVAAARSRCPPASR